MRTGRIYQRSHRRFAFVQIEENMIALENPKFSQEQLAEIGKTCAAKWVVAAFIASRGDSRYTWGPFRPNCMSIPAITCERKTAKVTLLFSSINPQKTQLLPELKIFAGIDHLRRAGEWISR